jgi:hypothetical protein
VDASTIGGGARAPADPTADICGPRGGAALRRKVLTTIWLQLDLPEIPHTLLRVSARRLQRVRAGKDLDFAAAVIIEPLDASIPRDFAILETTWAISGIAHSVVIAQSR